MQVFVSLAFVALVIPTLVVFGGTAFCFTTLKLVAPSSDSRLIHEIHRDRFRPPFSSKVITCSNLEFHEHRKFYESEDANVKARKVKHIRIRIMEDVMKRLSDPKIIYTNKRATVYEIRNLLDHLKLSQLKAPNAMMDISNQTTKKSDDSTVVRIYSKVRREDKARIPNQRIEDALTNLENGKVVAVLRGGHPDRLFQRGCELAQMEGCVALEVALDTNGAIEVLSELALALPSSCILGAATVMTEKTARKAAQAGARFITSPVNPPNFINYCDSEGVLAIPGGFTPSELYLMLASGAKAVKLFPASSFTPLGLKQMMNVGPFQHIKVMASGGIALEHVNAWLDAGAMVVSIGTQLVGADTRLATPSNGQCLTEEEVEWRQKGRGQAEALFRSLSHANFEGRAKSRQWLT